MKGVKKTLVLNMLLPVTILLSSCGTTISKENDIMTVKKAFSAMKNVPGFDFALKADCTLNFATGAIPLIATVDGYVHTDTYESCYSMNLNMAHLGSMEQNCYTIQNNESYISYIGNPKSGYTKTKEEAQRYKDTVKALKKIDFKSVHYDGKNRFEGKELSVYTVVLSGVGIEKILSAWGIVAKHKDISLKVWIDSDMDQIKQLELNIDGILSEYIQQKYQMDCSVQQALIEIGNFGKQPPVIIPTEVENLAV